MTQYAILLCAGIGSRLRPITNNKPKCLLNINGKSLLELALDGLTTQCKVQNIIVATGYMSDTVDAAISLKGVTVVHNSEYETTNNMYTLNLALDKVPLGSDLIIMNGDIYLESHIYELINKEAEKNESFITCQKSAYDSESMKIIEQDGRVTHLSKGVTESEYTALSMDTYYMNVETVSKMRIEIAKQLETSVNMWTEVALANILSSDNIKPLFVPDILTWKEIDNLEDYTDIIQKIIGKQTIVAHDNVIFDLDGTLIHNGRMNKDIERLHQLLIDNSCDVYIMSNNTSFTPASIVELFSKHNININESHIFSPLSSAISELRHKHVHIFANSEIKNYILERLDNNMQKGSIDAVLITNNTEYTFADLSDLCHVVQSNQNVRIYCTHSDIRRPVEKGFAPDIDSIIHIIRTVCNREITKIYGKPNVNVSLSGSSVFVGDNLLTDMKQAKNTEMPFILTLEGTTSVIDLEKTSWQDIAGVVSSVSTFIED